jgi:hypothetical protein
MRLLGAIRTWICAGCRITLDIGRGLAKQPKRNNPKPRRLVGSQGRLQNQPAVAWTSEAVTPTQCGADFPMYDPRFSIDPATFKGGEFSRLGPGRYIEEPA